MNGEYEIHDPGSLRRYRTEIPNVVFDLGLNPYELALYCHYKRAAGAGKNGKCTKGRNTLAKETGMSAGMINKAKAGLQRRYKVLGNKSLITVTQQPRAMGGKPLDVVTITDIWDANFRQFSDQGAMSPHDIDTPPSNVMESSLQCHVVSIAMSPHDIKKEPIEERTNRRSGGVRVRAQTEKIPTEAPPPHLSETNFQKTAPATMAALSAVCKKDMNDLSERDWMYLCKVIPWLQSKYNSDEQAAAEIKRRFCHWPEGRTAPQISQIKRDWENMGDLAALKSKGNTPPPRVDIQAEMKSREQREKELRERAAPPPPDFRLRPAKAVASKETR